MLFLRVIAWYGAEKISLKKSCFYLYIRRRYEYCRTKTSAVILRVICMTYIVGFWHMSNYTEYSNFIAESKILADITLGILGGFIFLSGFLGGGKHFECVKEIMVYYKKRFITIYPLFLVSCFSLFFITRMGMGNYIVDLKQLGLTLVHCIVDI